jgi:hypothetical protein
VRPAPAILAELQEQLEREREAGFYRSVAHAIGVFGRHIDPNMTGTEACSRMVKMFSDLARVLEGTDPGQTH